jgi:hypothetical protein
MEINISDLTWSKFIYPRVSKSEKTVEAYVKALAIGAQFPPIKIQRVNNYTPLHSPATLILDGIHRFFAFEKKGKGLQGKSIRGNPLNIVIYKRGV